ncbi:MAG: oligosaccharide flippase family protein [Saprospiraceae bacterium]
MGIIKRQAIKQSIVNYLGVGIGAISTILIYPLARDTYGLARFLIDTGTLIAPFLLVGFGGVTIKFFNEFKTADNRNNGLLPLVLAIPLLSSLLFVGLSYLFRSTIASVFSHNDDHTLQYLFFVIPIAICLAFFQLLYNYSTNYGRIAIPAIFQNFIKVVLPLAILLLAWKTISLDVLVWSIVGNYVVALLAIMAYLYYQQQFKLHSNWSFLTKERRKRLMSYALFGLFGGIGSVLAFRIDSVMITTLLNSTDNGDFGIAAFIGNAIAIPTNAVNQISSPILSKAIQEKKIGEVNKIYKEASVNLLLVGLLLFLFVACSVESLFHLMPSSSELSSNPALIERGVYIVLLVGLARIIDMGTSVNNPIINFSPYYRFGLYAILALGIFNIFTNLFFIKILDMGIVGVAMATLVALTLYNLIKLIFIYRKFGIQPFSWLTLKLLAIAGLAFLAGYFWPSSNNSLLDIILRSSVVVVIYLPLVIYFRISEDLNDLLFDFWKKRS